jgi:hypothetical protein
MAHHGGDDEDFDGGFELTFHDQSTRALTAGERDSASARGAAVARHVRAVIEKLLLAPYNTKVAHAGRGGGDRPSAPNADVARALNWALNPQSYEQVLQRATNLVLSAGAVPFVPAMLSAASVSTASKHVICTVALAVEMAVAENSHVHHLATTEPLARVLLHPLEELYAITPRDLRGARRRLGSANILTGLAVPASVRVGVDAAVCLLVHPALLGEAEDGSAVSRTLALLLPDTGDDAPSPVTSDDGGGDVTLADLRLAVLEEAAWTLRAAEVACDQLIPGTLDAAADEPLRPVEWYRGHVASRRANELAAAAVFAVLLCARGDCPNSVALLTPLRDRTLLLDLHRVVKGELGMASGSASDTYYGSLALLRDVRRFAGSLAPAKSLVMPYTQLTAHYIDDCVDPFARRPWDRSDGEGSIAAIKNECDVLSQGFMSPEMSEAPSGLPAATPADFAVERYTSCRAFLTRPDLQGPAFGTWVQREDRLQQRGYDAIRPQLVLVYGCRACLALSGGNGVVFPRTSPPMLCHTAAMRTLAFIVTVSTEDNASGSHFPWLSLLASELPSISHGSRSATVGEAADEREGVVVVTPPRFVRANPSCPVCDWTSAIDNDCGDDEGIARRPLMEAALLSFLAVAAAQWTPARVHAEHAALGGGNVRRLMVAVRREPHQHAKRGRPVRRVAAVPDSASREWIADLVSQDFGPHELHVDDPRVSFDVGPLLVEPL